MSTTKKRLRKTSVSPDEVQDLVSPDDVEGLVPQQSLGNEFDEVALGHQGQAPSETGLSDVPITVESVNSVPIPQSQETLETILDEFTDEEEELSTAASLDRVPIPGGKEGLPAFEF